MNRGERLLLIDALLDGSISEADRLRIEAELIVDSEVRRDYYQRVQLDILLEREAAELSAICEPHQADGSSSPASAASPSLARWVGLLAKSALAIAASVLVVMAFSLKFFQSSDKDSMLAQKPTGKLPAEVYASGFAVLNGQSGATWSGASFSEGDVLPSEQLHLISGLAHIELFSGVQVVLEGEATFKIDSPMQITMLQGAARAHVPEPAQGFRLRTASGDVVDLGTEFSVNVDAEGADVHVIDGEVELHPLRNDLRRLDAGASLRLVGGGVVDARQQVTETVGPAEFQDLVRAKQQRRYAQWSDWQGMIKSHPGIVAHYRFQSDRPQPRLMENLAKGESTLASDGTIVAAGKSTDRWGRSEGAIDFSPVASRVRVDVGGEHRGLTLLCWVKINSLDRWYNSLFLTDGHEDREPHWQLMNDGRIFFSVKVPRSGTQTEFEQPVFYSPSIWSPSLSGRWAMLAVTYDVDHQKVTHYVNGNAISSESIPDHVLVNSIRIGQASICNWSEPMYRTDPEFVLRNLNGSMDEFAIFSGALSMDEILQWYELGNPNE